MTEQKYYLEVQKSGMLNLYRLPESALHLVLGVYVEVSDAAALRLFQAKREGLIEIRVSIVATEALLHATADRFLVG